MTSIFATLLLSIALISLGSSQPSSTTSALLSSTTAPEPWNATTDLQCECSEESFYCESDGRCSAANVAIRLRREIAVWLTNMADLNEFPGDARLRRWQEAACRWVSGQWETVSDLFLLEFVEEEELQPVCLRVAGRPASCTIAPLPGQGPTFSLSKDDALSKMGRMHRFLRCSESTHPLPNMTTPLLFCSSSDDCNAEEISVPLPAWLVYLLLGLLALVFLALVAIAVCVYRGTVWKRNYKVRENKYSANLSLPPKTSDV